MPVERGVRKIPKERIERVVDYYLTMETPSYAEALRSGGGYSAKTSRNAYDYFQRPDVQEVLNERRAEIREQAGVNTNMLVERLKSIAFGNVAKFIKVTDDGALDYDFTNATEEELKIINDLTVETFKDGRNKDARTVKRFKFSKIDSLRAIEMLGRILGAFKDKTEVSGEISLVERIQKGRLRVKDARAPQSKEES